MDETVIRSGPAEVIASGSVIAFAENPIEITYGPSGQRLKLVITFHDEEGEKEQRVEGGLTDPKTLKLKLFNFKNPLGSGSVRPIPFGVLNGRQLYFHYRAYDLGGSDKTIQYTIYVAEEVAGNE